MTDHANQRTALDRRAFVRLAGGVLAAPAVMHSAAWAQGRYPSRPVKIILPFGAGGVADTTVRLVSERLGERLNTRFVIENAPGAGGAIAAQRTLQSPADGYTLTLFSNGTAVSVGLFKSLPFDPVKEFVPISTLGLFDFVLCSSPATGFKTLGDFLGAARAKPGALNIGSVYLGSTQQLSAVLFNTEAKLKTEIIAFRNTPDVIVAALRNDVQLVIDSYSSLKAPLSDNSLLALACTGAHRSKSLPNVPTVAESGVPGFDVTSWNALFARQGTPQEAIDAIHAGLKDVLASEDLRARLLDLGIEAAASTPAELSAKLAFDIKRWTTVIENAGIQKQ